MHASGFLEKPYLVSGRRIDPITGKLSYAGANRHLRRKELEVLALLADAGGEFVPRSVFIDQVWQGNPIVGEQALNDTISALRRSLDDSDRDNPLIHTIPRRGYQLRATVRQLSRELGSAFAEGGQIEGRPGWRLTRLLERSDELESWIAEKAGDRRLFKFCRSERHLRKLRREAVLMRYVRAALAGREDLSIILDWQLEEPPFFLELPAPGLGTLRAMLQGQSIPELGQRLALMSEVAEALAGVHQAGLLHRGLSPDSVFVERRGEGLRAVLGGFDQAALDDHQRLSQFGIDAEGMSLHTALFAPVGVYSAPECTSGGTATAAADVYAFGVLLEQMMGWTLESAQPGRMEGASDALSELMLRCCAMDPESRPSARQVSDRLRALAARAANEEIEDVPPRREPEITSSAPSSAAEGGHAEAQSPTAAAADGSDSPERIRLAGSAALRLAKLPSASQRIGRYQILEELAQGGMGVVYLAEQNEPVQRRVALKLIRSGMDSQEVMARFEAERQALAIMNHPNISAIFDAGSMPGGYPYFVMEYVPGKSIKDFCDQSRLNLRARVRLFLQVCDGVLHAHQKGLIHRDLKPSNILVKQRSDLPALVKLIDFGVAKSLTGSFGKGAHTRIGSFVGSPIYSCPEQVTDPTRDIDIRADIYSLGVVLYELLAGTLPFAAKELEAGNPAELARKVRSVRTTPMMRRFSELEPEARQRVAQHRALSIDGVAAQLGSDLDWIVNKCTAPDPDDRYPTVQDLRRDLQRWLDDRPVEARPSTHWYRLRKMIRRNRLNAAIVASAVLLLVTATAAALVGFMQAESESALAREAAREAEEIARFQQLQWEQLDPETMGIRLRERMSGALDRLGTPPDTPRSIPELLDQVNFTDLIVGQLRDDFFSPALKTIESDYAHRPRQQHALRQSIADSLYSLGMYDMALKAQELALRQRQHLLGPDAEPTLWSLFQRGRIHSAMANSARAQTDFAEVHQRALTARGADDPLSVIARFAAARESETRDVPIELYRESLAQRLKTHPEEDDWVIEMRLTLARVLAQQGQHSAAIAQLQSAVHSSDSDGTTPTARQIEILTTMGTLARSSGDIFAAAEHFEEAYRSARMLYGSTHSATLSTANALAYGLIYSGRAAAAEILMQKTLADWQPKHGKNNPWTIWLESIVADTWWCQGRLEEASLLMGQATQRITPDFFDRFSIFQYHGRFPRELGRLDQARQVLRDAIGWGSDSERKGALIDLGELEHAAGNLTLAEQILRDVHASLLQEEGERHYRTLWAASRLATVWGDLGRTGQAREMLEQTWPKQNPWEAYETIRRLAELEFAQKNSERARVLARQAAEMGRKHLDPRSPEWALLRQTLQRTEAQPADSSQ